MKTLIMRLSLVTEWISGPGNCPLIKIPWKQPDQRQSFSDQINPPQKNSKNKLENKLPVDECREDKCHRK